MNKTILKNYAKIIARVGVNVQKGQDVNIAAGVSDEYFVKYVIEECYKAGARKVVVDWISDIETKLGYKYQKVESLSEFPVWKEEKLKYQVEKLPARIFIDSADPDAMAGVDQEKMTAVRRILGPKTMPYREAMENKYQWTIVGIPSEAWAKKIFPNETKSNAMK
jgi:aminopeptidase